MRLIVALLIVVIVYCVQKLVYSKYWDKGLDVTMIFGDEFVREGESSNLVEIISNDKWLPLPIIQVKFEITKTFLFSEDDNSAVTDYYYRSDFFSMGSYRKITRQYEFICSKRGCYHMNDMDIIGRDFLISSKFIDTVKHSEHICVLPRRVKDKEIPRRVIDMIGELVKVSSLYEDPFQFRGIREYQSYDSMHSINWKSSAKSGSLMVNQYSGTYTRKVVILLNTEKSGMIGSENLLEYAISICSTLALKLIGSQIPVAFATNAEDVLSGNCASVEAGADNAHVHTIDMVLSRINIERMACDFSEIMQKYIEEKSTPVEYVIVSSYRRNDLLDAFDSYREKGYKVRMIVPELERVKLADRVRNDKDIMKWVVKE